MRDFLSNLPSDILCNEICIHLNPIDCVRLGSTNKTMKHKLHTTIPKCATSYIAILETLKRDLLRLHSIVIEYNRKATFSGLQTQYHMLTSFKYRTSTGLLISCCVNIFSTQTSYFILVRNSDNSFVHIKNTMDVCLCEVNKIVESLCAHIHNDKIKVEWMFSQQPPQYFSVKYSSLFDSNVSIKHLYFGNGIPQL